jgi:transcriptional regulator GlxA family with amidase domain
VGSNASDGSPCPSTSSPPYPSRRRARRIAILAHLAQADPLIQRFELWARNHLKAGVSLQEAASELATSARTPQRRCQDVLGKSPLAYVQDLRVEHAQSLLHGSGLGIDAIAAEVGYVDGETLRTLLRQRLGRGADLRGKGNQVAGGFENVRVRFNRSACE